MKLRATSLAAMLLLSGVFATANADEVRRPYIVQLADKPVASYTGDISGLKATKPAAGKTLDVSAQDVQAYINYLDQKQNTVLSVVGAAPVLHNYQVVFNGFSALLTDAEVRKLKKTAGVAAISVDEPRELLTNYTPGFLGLDKADGLWSKLGGISTAGEGIVIGVVDSGVWPENPAFADRVDANGVPTFDPSGTLVFSAPPATWKGTCEAGEGFSLSNCNNKLIGAQAFDRTYRSLVDAGTYTPHWSDFRSPRDNGGHGTHTSTTAGGNSNVQASAAGIPMGAVSGMAPRARVAVYKVCWSYQDPANPSEPKNSCFTGDNVAAIEKAVKDGVNVINFSISGSQTSFTDAVEQAFFGASNAGVFVAASAGNSGPANQVAHISPWLTTVAASTHDRLNAATATLGNGTAVQGASLNLSALPQTATILSSEAALAGADVSKADLCYGSADGAVVLDPAKIAGKVVVCTRGATARVNKSAAVAAAGGVGMIMIDNGAGLVAEVHAVPTVHVASTYGTAIRGYVAGNAAATSAISTFAATRGTDQAPKMAGFSSRGPNKGNLNMLKPDLTAPGVDILAGVIQDMDQAQHDAIANGSTPGIPDWAFYQGTSMSSPHVAGLGALIKQLHPDWTPAMIKSALMTTGSMTFNDGQPGMANGQLPWAQGAGHVNPNLAADPGLVYDAGTVDYQRFLCGINSTAVPAATCQSIGSIQAYNLNLPSLTASNVLGKLSLTRTVTNVGSSTATYTAAASLPGFAVTVSPATLTLAPGEKQSFTVNLTRTDAAQDVWKYGELVWTDGSHRVRSPLTAKASMVAATSALYSEAVSGVKLYTIGTGFTGPMSANKGGLKEATLLPGTVGPNADADGGVAACNAGGGAGVVAHNVVVPAGSLVARFALFDSETTGHGADDLDLLVVNAAGTAVGSSGGATANEQVTLMNPAAGTYKVCVIGYAPQNDSSTYSMSSWVVGTSDVGGNMKVMMPGKAYTGGTATAGISWSGLTAGKRYLGAVQYVVSGANQGTTMIEVDATDPLPLADGVRATALRAQ